MKHPLLTTLLFCCVLPLQAQNNPAEPEKKQEAARIKSFKKDLSHANLSALVSAINAADRGASTDAEKEYERRLSLLTEIARWREKGNPSDPDAVSLKGLQDELAQIQGAMTTVKTWQDRLDSTPVELAGVTVLLVPGTEAMAVVPSTQTPRQGNYSNPSRKEVLELLQERKKTWQERLLAARRPLDRTARQMEPRNTAMVVDDFGDARPESLPAALALQSQNLTMATASIQGITEQIDALAAGVNFLADAKLPTLSPSPDSAQIKSYEDKISAVHVVEGDDLKTVTIQSNILNIRKLLPALHRQVLQASESRTAIVQLKEKLEKELPKVLAAERAQVEAVEAVLADVDRDIDFLSKGGDNQAVIDRKKALLKDKLLPALQGRQDVLKNILIPRQKESIASLKAEGEAIAEKQAVLREANALIRECDGQLKQMEKAEKARQGVEKKVSDTEKSLDGK